MGDASGIVKHASKSRIEIGCVIIEFIRVNSIEDAT